MSALDVLSGLLRTGQIATERPWSHFGDIEAVISSLQSHINAGVGNSVPQDLQQAAVYKFWETQRLSTLRDARLVSFGMCVPSRSGLCIMEDRQRFRAVLDSQAGVDQWVTEPRWFRRCYQGLVRSYFTYDAKANRAPSTGKQNWEDLRDYLKERGRRIVDDKMNPEWVSTAVSNSDLFGEDPCAPYAQDMLSGDTSKVDRLCEHLGVVKSSWFVRELVFAQVQHATTLSHGRFTEHIPRLLEILAKNLILRDRGLILMLNKYAEATEPGINEPLRNAAVEWWGNPWLPSNETRWGGVNPTAREMVADWLKREFIEAFFAKLAEDGVGDRRRANFWLRYAKSMDNIRFALGTQALYSRDRDFVALRKKMEGLYTELRTSDGTNNAFIMTLGNLVAVEFGSMGNALYGYDAHGKVPFDPSRPVGTTVDAPNSLKHKHRLLWMQHQDGIRGWSKWEEMFDATLKEHFAIRPVAGGRRVAAGAAPVEPVQARISSASCSGTGDLSTFAARHSLIIEDLRRSNGNLWVRTDDHDLRVNKALLERGFRYKSGKGWWR